MTNELQLRFDPRTIEHLGIKMYSKVPSALAELIANAYDANAPEVIIELFDNDPNNKRIIITDNGDGMSYENVNEDFLVIGRKKRAYPYASSLGRMPTGRKGLGKLALFGLGKTIQISTQARNSEDLIWFKLDWDAIIESSGGIYAPVWGVQTQDIEKHGTRIEVSQLKRTTKFDLNQVALSIARLFNFYGNEFKVFISLNGSEKRLITRQDRLDGVDEQFSWDVSEIVNDIKPDYLFKDSLSGTIISSLKPLSSSFRGITLYARGRQANEASFFGSSEAGHTFSYVTGWIDADFIDDQTDDFISTNRQKVEWDQDELTQELQRVLQSIMRYIVRDWSSKRRDEKKRIVKDRSDVNVDEWLSKVSDEVKPNLTSLIHTLSDQPEIQDNVFQDLVKDINVLIPEYTNFHYRYLHPSVRDVAKLKYEQADYYGAFIEAMKRYKNKVKEKSGTTDDMDLDIMTSSFGKDKLLQVPKDYMRPDGQLFSHSTLKNIEEGNKFLAMGIVSGGRNVISHEEINDLKLSKLFTEKDCLDFLSLLSHLFNRLDNSEKRNP